MKAENFYGKIREIQQMELDEQPKLIKLACDKLVRDIRQFLSDEMFIHSLYDTYDFGIDKVIGTLYAVYGYYFYTGKRTATAIKKTIDGYQK